MDAECSGIDIDRPIHESEDDMVSNHCDEREEDRMAVAIALVMIADQGEDQSKGIKKRKKRKKESRKGLFSCPENQSQTEGRGNCKMQPIARNPSRISKHATFIQGEVS